MPDHLIAALLPAGALVLLFLSPWSRSLLASGGGNTCTEDMRTEDIRTVLWDAHRDLMSQIKCLSRLVT